MQQREIFLSHSGADVAVARDLRAVLEAAGYSCWLAPDDVTGTESWAEQILGAIAATRVMIVLISKHANKSQHVSREVNLAIARHRAVLPIRIESVAPGGALEYLLALVQRVDAFPPPIADHRVEILRRLEAILGHGVETAPAAVASAGDPVPSADGTTAADVPAAPDPLPTPARATVGVGARIAGFTIESLIGEGGMATVYRAHQLEPDRAVALKVIRADHAADDEYRRRFLAEKDTLARLEHPSIVPIYAAGQADGVLYIAMRLVDGPDLAGRLATAGRLTLRETVALLTPIADGVDYAHEMGVVHRDIKPSNIMIDRGGRPYLTDFGLGKRIEGAATTAAGIAIGTPGYMAPEQFTGAIDPEQAAKIDIYALGCVAHACLTGAPPAFIGSTERSGRAAANGAAQPGIAPGIDVVIGRALAPKPEDRFGSASEFIAALAAVESVAQDRTVPIATAGSSSAFGRSRRWVRANTATATIGVAAIVVAVVTAGAGLLAMGPPPVSPVVDRVATASPGPTIGPPSTTPSFVASATASPLDSASPSLAPATQSIEPETPPPATPSPTAPPIVDSTRPTGGKVVINDGDGVTTSTSVTIKLTKATDASGIAGYQISNKSTLPSTVAIPFDSSFSWNLGGSSAGSRTVYVWFRDASPHGNWSTAVHDSITFDHAPVAKSASQLTFSYSASTLGASSSFTLVFFEPAYGTPIASDTDGLSTLKVMKLWIVRGDGTIDNEDAALINAGTRAHYSLPANYCNMGNTTFTYGFTVEDDHHVQRTGGFYLHVCY